jgi:hypothetical protein
MKTEPEFEEKEEGGWTARIPDLPMLVARGRTRHEAAVGLTVSGLRLLAERIETRASETDDNEPSEIVGAIAARDSIVAILREMLAEASGNIPNAETIAALEELENGGGVSFEGFEDMLAKLHAPD